MIIVPGKIPVGKQNARGHNSLRTYELVELFGNVPKRFGYKRTAADVMVVEDCNNIPSGESDMCSLSRTTCLLVLGGMTVLSMQALLDQSTSSPPIESAAEREERERQVEGLARDWQARFNAVELLVEGRATLRETAQRFRALAHGRSDDLLHYLSVYHPGRSVDELHYLHVLNYVEAACRQRGRPELAGDFRDEFEQRSREGRTNLDGCDEVRERTPSSRKDKLPAGLN
jgi:hypothetical protein